MMDLGDHAADRGRVGTFYNLLHAAKAQAANGLAHVARTADKATYPLDFKRFTLGGGHGLPDAALRKRPLFPLPFHAIRQPWLHLLDAEGRRTSL
jgi:hypothetical protein